MTREHLEKILSHGLQRLIGKEEFERIYEPEFYELGFDEHKLLSDTRFMQFDHKTLGFEFKHGKVGCSGVTIEFTSPNYDQIMVDVGYDSYEKCLYNHLLIVPYYTQTDYAKASPRGISQKARRITNIAQAKAYIKQLHKRFECPSRDVIHNV